MFDNSNSIIKLVSMDKYNAVYEGGLKRQKWFDEYNQQSKKVAESDASVSLELSDDYICQQNLNDKSVRSIKYKESISRQEDDQSVRDDSLRQTEQRIQSSGNYNLQLLQKRSSDNGAYLDEQNYNQVQRFPIKRIMSDYQESDDKVVEESLAQESENKSFSKNMSIRRTSGAPRRSQLPMGKLTTSIEDQFNSIISKFKSKKTDYFKLALFYNRFCTILINMLNYLRPSGLTPFQLKMIGDASHGMIAHHSGGLHGNYFNIQDIMHKLKFNYGFFHNKLTYQRFQNFLVRADNILYFFAEKGIVFRKLLNCMRTHLPCIDPFSPLFLLWELFILLIILHLFFVIPYRVGFVQDTDPTQQYLYLELYFLILDSVLKLNKKTYIEGSFTQDRYKIFKHYLQNEALYDFWSLYVLQLTPNSWWTLFFVIKYPQLSKMINKVKQDLLTSEQLNSLLDLIILLYRLLMFTHIFACLWNWIGIQERESGSKSWITYYEQDQQSAIDNYILALYFSVVSICTIGYGDITPQTIQERAFTIIMILVSSVFVGYNINSVGLILENLNKQDKQLTDHLRRVNAFMRTHKIDKELQDKTRKAISNLYVQQEMSRRAHPVDQLEGVSKFLKDEILCNAYMQAVNANAFFSSCSRSFQQKIALQFQEQFYTYEEEIVKQNEEKDYTPTIYYIAQGRVDLYLQIGNTQKIVKSISAGEYFGQQEFFTGANASTLSVKSTDMTYVYYLTLENFLNVAQTFPEDKQLFLHNRDTILYRKDYSVVGVKCQGCESSSHTIKSCPIFFYRYRNQYSKINQTQKEFRKNFKRRTFDRDDRHKTLLYLQETIEIAQVFADDNDSLLSDLFNDLDIDDQQNDQENNQQINSPKISSTGLIPEEQKSDKSPSHIKSSFNSLLNAMQIDNTSHVVNNGNFSQPKSNLDKINSLKNPQLRSSLQVIAEASIQEDSKTAAQIKSNINSIQNQNSSLNDSQEPSILRQRTNSNSRSISSSHQPINSKLFQKPLKQRKQRMSILMPSDKVLIAYQSTKVKPINRMELVSDQNALKKNDPNMSQEVPIRRVNHLNRYHSKIEENMFPFNNQKRRTLLIQQGEQVLANYANNQVGQEIMKAFSNYLCQNSYERVIKNFTYFQLSKELKNLYQKKKLTLSQNHTLKNVQFENIKTLSYYVIEKFSQKNLDELLEQLKTAINYLKGCKYQRSRFSKLIATSFVNNKDV